MGRFKEFSKQCRECGVEWLKDFSNKHNGRALCLDCMKLEYEKRKEAEKIKAKEHVTLVEKKKPYTFMNRKPFWREVNSELKGMKKREEWLPFIQKRMDEILMDTQLMDYINDTQNADYNK